MSTVIHDYEQQYSTLSAEITVKIGKIPNLIGKEKQQVILSVENLFAELRELLEQMELEARDLPYPEKDKYVNRVKSYKSELSKLENDLKKARIGIGYGAQAREDLLGYDESLHDADQKTHLLDNSERLERSSRKLEQGYQIAEETEKLGAGVLTELQSQREKITHARDRLHETSGDLGRSSRVLSHMSKRIIQNRLLLIGVVAILVITISLAIYFASRKHA